jgi:hypothetical protein
MLPHVEIEWGLGLGLVRIERLLEQWEEDGIPHTTLSPKMQTMGFLLQETCI